MVRGVSGGPLSSGVTAEQHCAKAKSDVHARAKLMCETIVTNGGYRNAKWTCRDSPCDCQQPNSVVMTCIADLAVFLPLGNARHRADRDLRIERNCFMSNCNCL